MFEGVLIRAVVVARHSRLEWTEFPRAGDDSQNQKTQLQRPMHVRTWSRCCQRDQRHDRTGGFAFGGLNCECLRAGFNTTRVEREAGGEREKDSVGEKVEKKKSQHARREENCWCCHKKEGGHVCCGLLGLFCLCAGVGEQAQRKNWVA